MAIGYPPKYSTTFEQKHLAPHQLLMLCLYTAQSLEWEVNYISNRGIIAFTNHGLFHFNASLKVLIENQTATLISTSTGNELFDLGKNKKTVEAFLDMFKRVKEEYSLQTLDENYAFIQERLVSDAQDLLRKPDPSALSVLLEMLAVFIPRKSNFFTALLLDLNILVFILMSLYGASLMNPSADSLLAWGDNYKPLTLAGEGWRLLTSCFVHIGVMHLLMNMYALLYIGYVLEPILGNIRFISAYLMTGLLASLNSLWWHDLSVSAGASGAIFGLYGVFLALLTTSIVEKSTRKPLFISIAIFIIYNLMNGLKEGVDNAAHIGGILSGIVIGYAFLPTLRNKTSKLFNTGILILLLTSTLVLTAVALKRIPNYIGKYDYIMMQTFKNDSIALSIYDMADSMSTEEKLIQINNRAITPMQENILLMQQTDTMQLPPAIRYEIQLYKKYYQLRLSSFILYSKAIAEDTDLYNTQLNTYYHQIDSLTKKIH